MANTRVIDIVSAIHKRIQEQAATYETPEAMEEWSSDLAKLHSAYNTAYYQRNVVGSVPALPKTPLGVAAGWAVRFGQRILFWYTPQIRNFNEAVMAVLNRLCSLEDRKFRASLALADRLEKLERETGLLRAAQSVAAPPVPAGVPAAAPYTRARLDPQDFYFQLQGTFQSSVQADVDRLEMYRSAIANLDPKLPEGTWFDIGCGRGKWMKLARNAGHEAAGVDSNPAAIAQCRDAGFDVTEGDALAFLQSAEDRSFAVVTAFHVLEHVPFEYCLNLVYQIARTLKPGGVFLIETPHPANLLMAAEQFWIDPTHNRPLPLPLMVFLFEYCGLQVAHTFEVNPRPESEHLPLRELDLASRLDLILYGPQDYAVMGRRHE
jgi:O-antigen chain-terminating methyltransferase